MTYKDGSGNLLPQGGYTRDGWKIFWTEILAPHKNRSGHVSQLMLEYFTYTLTKLRETKDPETAQQKAQEYASLLDSSSRWILPYLGHCISLSRQEGQDIWETFFADANKLMMYQEKDYLLEMQKRLSYEKDHRIRLDAASLYDHFFLEEVGKRTVNLDTIPINEVAINNPAIRLFCCLVGLLESRATTSFLVNNSPLRNKKAHSEDPQDNYLYFLYALDQNHQILKLDPTKAKGLVQNAEKYLTIHLPANHNLETIKGLYPHAFRWLELSKSRTIWRLTH